MWGEPPNSPQHPTRGRRLARRFRGSGTAALRAALSERIGRARVSGGTLARPSPTPAIGQNCSGYASAKMERRRPKFY